MISICLADEIITIEKNVPLSELLTQKNYVNKGFAIALNGKFIPTAHYKTTILQENDKIEIIVPMQGG